MKALHESVFTLLFYTADGGGMDGYMRQKKLSEREKLFCCYCKMLGNACEAAALAGYGRNRAREAAARLLSQREIAEEIGRVGALLDELPAKARSGLERLAFGSVNDAVSLLYLDDTPERQLLEELDLYCVSEIRRPKGGGMEIRFHDRHKALETLLAHEDLRDGNTSAASLYEALNKCAAMMARADGTPDAV